LEEGPAGPPYRKPRTNVKTPTESDRFLFGKKGIGIENNLVNINTTTLRGKPSLIFLPSPSGSGRGKKKGIENHFLLSHPLYGERGRRTP